jgi:hypothetical protein
MAIQQDISGIRLRSSEFVLIIFADNDKGLQILKEMKSFQSYQISRTTHKMTSCYITEDLNLLVNYSHNTSCNLLKQYACVNETDNAYDPHRWLGCLCAEQVLHTENAAGHLIIGGLEHVGYATDSSLTLVVSLLASVILLLQILR